MRVTGCAQRLSVVTYDDDARWTIMFNLTICFIRCGDHGTQQLTSMALTLYGSPEEARNEPLSYMNFEQTVRISVLLLCDLSKLPNASIMHHSNHDFEAGGSRMSFCEAWVKKINKRKVMIVPFLVSLSNTSSRLFTLLPALPTLR